MPKWVIVYFMWGALVLGWMGWRYVHLPNCLASYGEASYPHDTVDQSIEHTNDFIACEDDNRATAFETQAIAIGAIAGGSLIGLAFWAAVIAITDRIIARFRFTAQSTAQSEAEKEKYPLSATEEN